MNREEVLQYSGTFTLYDMLEREYPAAFGRIICAFLDEVKIMDPADTPVGNRNRARRESGRLRFRILLDTTLPEELERVELLAFGSPPVFMLQIYTREFMQKMFDLELELRTPVLVSPGPGFLAVCR
ncbi:MAG: hypothetical protein IID38_12080 [Planctomycetes bacterium]|nr:hypothetical protein [Planctomycetota bacterium]